MKKASFHWAFALSAEEVRLNATREINGKVTLRWNSFRGGTYRVEYNPTLLETNWTLLNPEVMAAGNTASVTDNPRSASERYYRVRLLP